MDITQIYLTDCFVFCSIIDNHDKTKCKFLFSINFRYIHIYSTFWRSKSRKILSVFSTSPGLVICFPHIHLLNTVKSVRALPVCSICLRGPPTQGDVKWNELIWIVGGPSLSMVRLWKTAQVLLMPLPTPTPLPPFEYDYFKRQNLLFTLWDFPVINE